MALNITINKTAVAASYPAGSTVATAVASGGTTPYTYSIATGGDYFNIDSSTGVVTTKALMDASSIQSFSVTATDSNSTPESITSGVVYPNIQAAIQNKFSESNMIYKITKDIDLGNAALTIPTGCTLDFQGGSFSNGVIVGNSTVIKPSGYKIQNVELQGTFKYFDGVNAISSEGLCLNNTYDVLDVNNLSKEVISDYQIVDSNYSILPQFRNIRSVRLATGQFAGFPTSVINNNVLYCFYYQAATHASTPGIQENIYYKYSSDKGITWSEEKEWVLPSSDSNGTYRSYRTAYVVPFGSNLLFGIFCTTTTSSAIGGSL